MQIAVSPFCYQDSRVLKGGLDCKGLSVSTHAQRRLLVRRTAVPIHAFLLLNVGVFSYYPIVKVLYIE